MDPHRQDNEYPAGNDVGLTEAETAALATRDAPAVPAETPPVAATPPAPAAADPADAAATAAAAAVATPAEPAADPPAPATQGGVFAPDLTPKSDRDFDAELTQIKTALKELNTKSQSGEIEDDEYEAARERLLADRDGIVKDQTKFETKQELAADMAAQTWSANRDAFLKLPENAVLARSKEHQAMWRPIMQIVVDEAATEGKTLQDWELLTLSRDRLFQTIGITAAAPKAPEAPAKPNRKPPLDTLPPDTSRAPAASVPSGRSADDLAELSVQDREAYIAGLSDAQREKLLAAVPGAFIDD